MPQTGPLPGAWARSALPALERRLASDDLSLHGALRELAADFAAWKGNSINAFDLSDSIHDFHKGIARELWSFYNGLKSPMLVAAALERGVLTAKDVPAPLRAKLNARAV